MPKKEAGNFQARPQEESCLVLGCTLLEYFKGQNLRDAADNVQADSR